MSDECKHMRLPVSLIPREFMQEYNLEGFAEDGFTHVETRGSVCGTHQAYKVAHE